LEAPDNEIDLKIIGGTHLARRTSRDVTVMQIKGGHVTQFPDLTQVSTTFPNLDGFSITFTGLKKIEREKLKNLSRLKFFLISDNAIEEIPADTFYDLKNLELIDICRNKIKRMDPAWLNSMPRLRVFKARTNQFQNVPAGMFRNNPQLEEILFDGNKIVRNEVDYSSLKKLKQVAILQNQCIDLEYCQDPNKPKCIRSLQQFNYLINGYCGVFN
jgi:Leucine-rich repeat (LRR) protein